MTAQNKKNEPIRPQQGKKNMVGSKSQKAPARS